ncbi:MAG: hypothetical protein FWD14_04490 [Treponema sp.]|nr:hypothetical protein [Treponema sp.]
MKTKFYFFAYVLLMLVFSSCGGEKTSQPKPGEPGNRAQSITASGPQEEADPAMLLRSLDEMAELERAGSWIRGMALTESGIRERAKDYAGAVTAAYKELSWAYGLGLIQKEEIEQGLLNILAAKNEDEITAATNAVLMFMKGRWDEAAEGLSLFFNEFDEPDGFGRWMLLVCELEKNKAEPAAAAAADRRAGAAYRSIRARYAQFPEYWYRGARAFSGVIAAEFAENCINLSVQGPFAQECRKILASYAGLKIDDGVSIKTKREIEAIISQSVNSGNPGALAPLLPLIGLPDNPYTVYAIGALRALTGVPGFREYFNRQAASSSGRLAERLSYICRG